MKFKPGHWKGISLLLSILLILIVSYHFLTSITLNDSACDKVWNFKRCGSSLYYGDKSIKGGDAESFQVLNFNFAKDKNHLYYGFVAKTGDLFDAKYSYNIKKIQLSGMDVDSLKTSSEYFMQDNNHVYRATLSTDTPLEKVSYLDPESFEILDRFELMLDGYTPQYSKTSGLIYKDKNHVFMHDYIIDIRDPASFRLINPNLGKDKYQKYPLFKIMPKDLRNRTPYGVVGSEVYYNGTKIKYADGNSFEVFPEYFLNAVNDRHYAKDNNHVFYDEHLIKGADPESFELMSTLHLTLAQAEAGYIVSLSGGGFTHINTQYARDKNNIYYEGKKITADSESFRVMELGYGYDAFDQNNKYLNGENIGTKVKLSN